MLTLIWQRPTAYDSPRKSRTAYSTYRAERKVTRRTPYRIVVDGPDEALRRLLELDTVEVATFDYRPMKTPVRMELDGAEYDLYSIKRGAPK